MTTVVRYFLGVLGLATGSDASAQDAYLRVVDVGAGLCVVAIVPGEHAMVYDAGRGYARCLAAVDELVPGARIDLMVLSHSDADHIGAAAKLVEGREIGTILHPGDARTGEALDAARHAISSETGAEVWDMATRPVPFGQTFSVGAAVATLIAGWSDGHQTEAGDPVLTDDAKLHNALSLVIRFTYGGHSVLITGDTVGRLDGDNDGVCKYAERLMVENTALSVDSDVLVGQHHGADNATSNCFIRAVSPQWVIFSAGSQYRHPRQSTANRLIANGVDKDRILRTDRGDNEPVEDPADDHANEWIYGGWAGCRDKAGDDDVEIRMPVDSASPVDVRYRLPMRGC